MAKLLFILGHSCSGKTTIAQNILKERIQKNEPWCLLDKDTIGDALGRKILNLLGLPEEDRDSPEYKKHVRDLEYVACLDVIREQLENGVNVVTPGPWTKELKEGFILSQSAMRLPKDTQITHAFLDLDEDIIHSRMLSRAHPRDKWKLDNWNIFQETLKMPPIVIEQNLLSIKDTDINLILSKINKLIND